jgi:hypothetical protein
MSAAPAVEKNGALITVFCAESLRLIALRSVAISLLTGNLRNRCCQDLIRPVIFKDLRANSLLGRAGNLDSLQGILSNRTGIQA